MMAKDDGIAPGVTIQQSLKHYYIVKASYAFLMEFGPNWRVPFCATSMVFGGDREALEFAEKSLDMGKKTVIFMHIFTEF